MPTTTGFDLIQNIQPGKHYYLFYEDLHTYMEVLVPYFQEGLLKGDRCLWLISDYLDWETVYGLARRKIEDLDDRMDCDQIRLFSASKWYLNQGRFDRKRALQNATEFIEQNQKDESVVIRAAGDLGDLCVDDWSEVCLYEEEISQAIQSQKIIGLCAYPIQKCTPSQAKRVMELHDDVLIGRV
ncbi:MAG: MEDS domain-containing protein [Candidatus Omnitrophica bacterium]|nr:MEDS domain-containing protein [Candidatus Omnitrophota bacterium]